MNSELAAFIRDNIPEELRDEIVQHGNRLAGETRMKVTDLLGSMGTQVSYYDVLEAFDPKWGQGNALRADHSRMTLGVVQHILNHDKTLDYPPNDSEALPPSVLRYLQDSMTLAYLRSSDPPTPRNPGPKTHRIPFTVKEGGAEFQCFLAPALGFLPDWLQRWKTTSERIGLDIVCFRRDDSGGDSEIAYFRGDNGKRIWPEQDSS